MTAENPASASATLAIAGIVPDGNAAPVLLFRRIGENYDVERRCIGVVVGIDDGVTLRFAIPVPRADFTLLLLPVLPGTYAIHRMEVGGEVVVDLARRIISAHEHLEPACTPNEVRYSSGRGRPSIEIDLRGLGNLPDSESTEVLVAISRETLRVSLDRLGDRVASVSGEVRDLARDVGGILLGHGERLHQLAAADAEQAVRIGESKAEVIASIEPGIGKIEAAVSESNALHKQALERDEAVKQSLIELSVRLERLQTRTDRLVDAVENVFWRRWLRRLRGSQG